MLQPRLRSSNLFDIWTLGYSSKPTLEHGHLFEVPTLIVQKDEHLSAKCAEKFPARARSMQITASLRFDPNPRVDSRFFNSVMVNYGRYQI